MMLKLAFVASLTAGTLLLAQEAPTTIVGAFIVIALSMAGVVAYVIRKQMDDAKAERAQAKTERDEAKMERNFLLGEARADRNAFGILLSKDREDNKTERQAQEARHERQIVEMASMHLQALKNMREAVHDVKDTAQATVMKVAVDTEKALHGK